MNQIRLPASKLASCIGLNQYVTIHDAVFELVNCLSVILELQF